jgi:hypothetical protein
VSGAQRLLCARLALDRAHARACVRAAARSVLRHLLTRRAIGREKPLREQGTNGKRALDTDADASNWLTNAAALAALKRICVNFPQGLVEANWRALNPAQQGALAGAVGRLQGSDPSTQRKTKRSRT